MYTYTFLYVYNVYMLVRRTCFGVCVFYVYLLVKQDFEVDLLLPQGLGFLPL